MTEIRGQRAADWPDVYALRRATTGALPYLSPDRVKEELAQPPDRTWPMVAVRQLPEGHLVVARANLQLGWGRRAHGAWLTLERHPDYGDEPSRELLDEAVRVAENWWNRHRLEAKVPVVDRETLALFEALGFEREARLRQGVRRAGELVDEIVLARLSGHLAEPAEGMPTTPSPPRAAGRRATRSAVTIRGGSADDWEDLHAIWLQPSVIWGTMQLPYPSADWNRERVQKRQPARFWTLVAEVEEQVVGVTGLRLDEHERRHVGHIGMMVHADFQGLGIGSALLDAAMDLAENWLGLTRLQLEVYTDNERAIGLYEKRGFETEGLHRAYSYRDGRYIDALVMGRLR